VVDDEDVGGCFYGVEFSPSCSCIAVESAGGALGSSVAGRFEAAHGFELRFVGGPVQVEVVAGR